MLTGVWQAGKMMTKREAAQTGWCSQNGQRQPLAATVPKRAVAATVPKRAVAATASAFVRLPIKGLAGFQQGSALVRLPSAYESCRNHLAAFG
jgi:hypothetical protein